jgi:hypothetical protein
MERRADNDARRIFEFLSEEFRDASRLCRYRPSLSNQSNRWGQPWQQQAFRNCGPAQMLPTVHDPEVNI